MEKPTLRGNVLSYNISTTSLFNLLGHEGPVLTQRDSITPQSAPNPLLSALALISELTTAPGTAAPPIWYWVLVLVLLPLPSSSGLWESRGLEVVT